MRNFFKKYINNSIGATAIEYALIAALIAVVAIAAMRTIGTNMTNKMNDIGTALQ